MALHQRVEVTPLHVGDAIHFIGIGGVSMSGIAEMFAARGVRVSGSDREDSAALDRLRAAGVQVYVGHRAEQVPDDVDAVVLNSAIAAHNPELIRAQELGVPRWHRSTALAALLGARRVIAVTGSHGKTTTSAMTVAALAGQNPSYMVGSVLASTGRGSELTSSDVFVIEADESDGSFLQFDPAVVVVTNVEADHLDNWGSVESYVDGFKRFVSMSSVEQVVLCADDPVAASLASATTARVLTYGQSPAADVVVSQIEEGAGRISAHISYAGEGGLLELGVPGVHNVLNAAAAYAVARTEGVSDEQARADVGTFGGTARRFQPVGSANGVDVIDDYAHHPTEVAATLAAASKLGAGRIVAVFQPHLYSRTRDFAADFASALSVADVVVLTDVYPAREEPIPGVDGALIARQIPHAHYVQALADVADYVAALTRPGDAVLTIGAGSITTVGPAIVAALTESV